MYEATTNLIRIRVEPSFVEEQSSPADEYYFWSYEVEIKNMGTQSVQLRSRCWRITDASGYTEEVQGAGVVGQEPIIKPGASFSYKSGAPLYTSSGVMVGTYSMQSETGEFFDVSIPAFSLDSPYAERILN